MMHGHGHVPAMGMYMGAQKPVVYGAGGPRPSPGKSLTPQPMKTQPTANIPMPKTPQPKMTSAQNQGTPHTTPHTTPLNTPQKQNFVQHTPLRGQAHEGQESLAMELQREISALKSQLGHQSERAQNELRAERVAGERKALEIMMLREGNGTLMRELDQVRAAIADVRWESLESQATCQELQQQMALAIYQRQQQAKDAKGLKGQGMEEQDSKLQSALGKIKKLEVELKASKDRNMRIEQLEADLELYSSSQDERIARMQFEISQLQEKLRAERERNEALSRVHEAEGKQEEAPAMKELFSAVLADPELPGLLPSDVRSSSSSQSSKPRLGSGSSRSSHNPFEVPGPMDADEPRRSVNMLANLFQGKFGLGSTASSGSQGTEKPSTPRLGASMDNAGASNGRSQAAENSRSSEANSSTQERLQLHQVIAYVKAKQNEVSELRGRLSEMQSKVDKDQVVARPRASDAKDASPELVPEALYHRGMDVDKSLGLGNGIKLNPLASHTSNLDTLPVPHSSPKRFQVHPAAHNRQPLRLGAYVPQGGRNNEQESMKGDGLRSDVLRTGHLSEPLRDRQSFTPSSLMFTTPSARLLEQEESNPLTLSAADHPTELSSTAEAVAVSEMYLAPGHKVAERLRSDGFNASEPYTNVHHSSSLQPSEYIGQNEALSESIVKRSIEQFAAHAKSLMGGGSGISGLGPRVQSNDSESNIEGLQA